MITVLAIGSNKDDSFRKIEAEYLKRLSAFCRIQVTEVKDEPNPHPGREKEEQIVMEKEGARALSKISPADFVILLDLHGKQLDSPDPWARPRRWYSARISDGSSRT